MAVMRIGRGDDYLRIEPLSRGGKNEPRRDFHFRVKLRLGDFQGLHDDIRIDDEELKEFIRALEELERTRSGSVTLRAISADDFCFTLRSIDAAGHFEIDVVLRRIAYGADGYHPTRLSGVLDFNAEYFRALVRDFKKLFKNFP